MTKNVFENAAILQALQYTTVSAAVDQPEAVKNGKNNNVTTIHNVLCNCTMVEIA